MNDQVTCFLPCRKGSERIPQKNIKPFAGYPNGLIQIKLKQLLACESLDKIVLSTNDEEILDYAAGLNQKTIHLHHRDDSLSSSLTSTDDLIAHARELIPQGVILWTHVTSPFITAEHYEQIIQFYFQKIQDGYDSLMTTTAIKGFLWRNGEPVNYDRSVEKWPRTQTLSPIQEVNSGVFLAASDIYRKDHDRIGSTPYLYDLDKLVSHDIDWPEDFSIAECMAEKGLVQL